MALRRKLALGRGGWTILLAAALLAGCGESQQRKAAKEANETQKSAARDMRNAEEGIKSQVLNAKTRDERYVVWQKQAEDKLRDLVKAQPDNWSAKAELGNLLLQKADFQSSRVNELLSSIRNDISYAWQSWGDVRDYQLQQQHYVDSRAGYQGSNQAIADERAKLNAQLSDLRDGKPGEADVVFVAADPSAPPGPNQARQPSPSLARCVRQFARLTQLAATQNDAGEKDRKDADALQAQADNMALNEAKLNILGRSYQGLKSSAEHLGQAANLECEADGFYDAKARDAAGEGWLSPGKPVEPDAVAKRFDALMAPTATPDEAAAHAKHVTAIRSVMDRAAEAELAILAIRDRLTGLEREEADNKSRMANADQALGDAPPAAEAAATSQPDLKSLISNTLGSIRTRLASADGDSARLEDAVSAADLTYDEAIGQLTAGANGARQAHDGLAELNARLDLVSARGNQGAMHLMLADAAAMFDDARSLAREPAMAGFDVPAGKDGQPRKVKDLRFGPYARAKSDADQPPVKLAAEEQAKAIGEIQEAAWTIDDMLPLAQTIESNSRNGSIREAKLWTGKVLADRRASLSKLAGVDKIGPRPAPGAAPVAPRPPAAGQPAAPPAGTP